MDKLKDLRKLSVTDLNKVKKDELINAIHDSTDGVPDNVAAMILQELKDIKASQQQTYTKINTLSGSLDEIKQDYLQLKASEENLKVEVSTLRDEVRQQAGALQQQQSYLEKLDMKERGKNMIIVGIPEDTFLEKEEDSDKVHAILNMVDGIDSSQLTTIKRIGPETEDKVRPVLVSFTSMELRNKVVTAFRNLNHPSLEGVRLKKDTHPAARREWQRLFEVKETEQKKPENIGHTISVDMKKRQVLRDDEVIDTWKPSFF